MKKNFILIQKLVQGNKRMVIINRTWEAKIDIIKVSVLTFWRNLYGFSFNLFCFTRIAVIQHGKGIEGI